MAINQDEMQSIVTAVISAIRTNSQTIDQLSLVASLSDSDCFEINGGKRVAYSTLRDLITALTQEDLESINKLISKNKLNSVDITVTENSATLVIKSDDRTFSANIPIVSATAAGIMTAAQARLLGDLSDRVSELPILPYSGNVSPDGSVSDSAPGRMLVTAAVTGGGVAVVWDTDGSRFLLRLTVGESTQFFSVWTEVADSAGGTLFQPSAHYSEGKLFADTSDGGKLSILVSEGDSKLLRPVGDYDWLLARMGALAESLAEMTDRLNELPVRDFDGIDAALLMPNSDSAGEVSPLGTTISVVYSLTCRQFFLKVVPHQVANTAYYGVWDEIVSSTGKLLAASSSEYQQVSDVDGSVQVLAGRLFHLKAEGSPARFYAFDGEQLRMVNSFAGQIRTLSQGLADAASELGLAQSKLARHDERLEELDVRAVAEIRWNASNGLQLVNGDGEVISVVKGVARNADLAALSEIVAGLRGDSAGARRIIVPLPFVFVEAKFPIKPGLVGFDLGSNTFRVDGGGQVPEGYNETLPDGSEAPSRSARFVCGNVVYRFTGSQMVNTAIEANPNQRLVRRMPSLSAHPGLAYIDRHRISVPLRNPMGGEEFRVSLKGLFYDWGSVRPLSELVPAGQGVTDLRIEDDSIVGTVMEGHGFNSDGDFGFDVRVCLCMPGSGGADGDAPGVDGRYRRRDESKSSFIGVRYDALGRKIFYLFQGAFPAPTVPPPTIKDAECYISFESRSKCRFKLDCNGFQGQVWLRRTNYNTGRVAWKWYSLKRGKVVRMQKCLVRLRRVTGSGMSPWAYFGVESDGSVYAARQERT